MHCVSSSFLTQGVVSEQPERFFVAELIREKIFLLYSQEIPYSVQVHITGFLLFLCSSFF
jgi:GTP-binding protein Era